MPAKISDQQREELAFGQRLLREATSIRGRSAEGKLPVIASYRENDHIRVKGFASETEARNYLSQQKIDDAYTLILQRRSGQEIYFI